MRVMRAMFYYPPPSLLLKSVISHFSTPSVVDKEVCKMPFVPFVPFVLSLMESFERGFLLSD